MPKIRIDRLEEYKPYKEKFPKRKDNHNEEFQRDSRKRNKKKKKNPLDQRS